MMMSIYREIYVQILGSAKDVYLRYLRESWQCPWQINVGFARDIIRKMYYFYIYITNIQKTMVKEEAEKICQNQTKFARKYPYI